MREYEKTHPWLAFSADLSKAPPPLWIMLGECKSKCQHISRQPLRPDIAKSLLQLYLAKGVLATVAIEGNTLSEAEASQYLKGDLKLPPSQEYLGQELDNIANVCNEFGTFSVFPTSEMYHNVQIRNAPDAAQVLQHGRLELYVALRYEGLAKYKYGYKYHALYHGSGQFKPLKEEVTDEGVDE